MMTVPLIDWIEGPQGHTHFIWGWLTLDRDADLATVKACGEQEATQVGGSRAFQVGKLLLRAMWRRHLGLNVSR